MRNKGAEAVESLDNLVTAVVPVILNKVDT